MQAAKSGNFEFGFTWLRRSAICVSCVVQIRKTLTHAGAADARALANLRPPTFRRFCQLAAWFICRFNFAASMRYYSTFLLLQSRIDVTHTQVFPIETCVGKISAQAQEIMLTADREINTNLFLIHHKPYISNYGRLHRSLF